MLIELQDRYKADGLEVVGVVTLDDFANVAPFAAEYKMNYTIVDGTTRQDVEEAYGPASRHPVVVRHRPKRFGVLRARRRPAAGGRREASGRDSAGLRGAKSGRCCNK